MNKLKSYHQGFGTIELTVIVVILIVIGATAWTLHRKQTNNAPTTSSAASTTKISAAQTTVKTKDPTADWVKVDSIGGGYSIKIPDGWSVTNYPGNTLNTDSITLVEGRPAAVTTASSPYAGDQKKFNVVLTDKQYTAPQWQTPSEFGIEVDSDYTIGSLQGKRYSIEYTQSVTGVTKGDKVYQYVFNLANGKQLSVVYMQNSGGTDNLSTVEQAIQTILIR